MLAKFSGGVANQFGPATHGNSPSGIALGADDNMWTADQNGYIDKITPAGIYSEYSTGINGAPVAITSGPDNALWFTESPGTAIGRITTTGTIAEYAIPSSNSAIGIASGPERQYVVHRTDGQQNRKHDDGWDDDGIQRSNPGDPERDRRRPRWRPCGSPNVAQTRSGGCNERIRGEEVDDHVQSAGIAAAIAMSFLLTACGGAGGNDSIPPAGPATGTDANSRAFARFEAQGQDEDPHHDSAAQASPTHSRTRALYFGPRRSRLPSR